MQARIEVYNSTGKIATSLRWLPLPEEAKRLAEIQQVRNGVRIVITPMGG